MSAAWPHIPSPAGGARLKHKGEGIFEFLRFQITGTRFVESLPVWPMRQHAIVERNPPGAKPSAWRHIGQGSAHELAHDVHVIPRRPERMFGDEPALGKDHEIDVRGASLARRRSQDRENGRVG